MPGPMKTDRKTEQEMCGTETQRPSNNLLQIHNHKQGTTTDKTTTTTAKQEQTENDRSILSEKKIIASRGRQQPRSGAGTTTTGTSTTTTSSGTAESRSAPGLLEGKLAIANRRWANDSSVPHQESSSIASYTTTSIGGDKIHRGTVESPSAVGVLEGKLAIARKGQQHRENLQEHAVKKTTTTIGTGVLAVHNNTAFLPSQVVSTTGTTTTTGQAGLELEDVEAPIAIDAYLVDEEAEQQYRQERERELRRQQEQQAFQELVCQMPHAEEIDPDELRQQKEKRAARAQQQRKRTMVRRAVGVTALAVTIAVGFLVIYFCVIAKDNDKQQQQPSREDQILQLLQPISGDLLHNKSSPRHDAFRWLVHDDPMKLTTLDNDDDSDDDNQGVPAFAIIERYVLVLFFLVTGGRGNWTNPYGFLTNASVCEWKDLTVQRGVACHSSGHVKLLQIDENNLYGTLPEELSALAELEEITLLTNKLHGTIPSSLAKNKRLERISLSDNYLSGTIPDLSSLRNFKVLNLYANFLTGTLPRWVTWSSELRSLNVDANFLSGTVPPFAMQDGLDYVILSNNLLEGTIPSSIGSLSVLEILGLHGNRLSGPIPTTIGQITHLDILFAYDNALSGTIPTEFGDLQYVTEISLDDNHFHGPIPTELGRLSNLVGLWLNNNNLSGTIPSQLAKLDELKYLSLQNNSITGNVGDLCLIGDEETHNHGLASLDIFVTDCIAYPEAEIVCPCCTHCCDDTLGVCINAQTTEAKCIEKATQKLADSMQHEEEKGTVCGCPEGGKEVACRDSDCMYCSDDGSVCYVDAETGIRLGIEEPSFLALAVQFVQGRDEFVSFQYTTSGERETCVASIDGNACDSCARVKCPGDGFWTFEVDCSSAGYGILSQCHPGNPFQLFWDLVTEVHNERDFPRRFDCIAPPHKNASQANL